MELVEQNQHQVGTAALCRALQTSRATVYRQRARKKSIFSSQMAATSEDQTEISSLGPPPLEGGPPKPPWGWTQPASAEQAATPGEPAGPVVSQQAATPGEPADPAVSQQAATPGEPADPVVSQGVAVPEAEERPGLDTGTPVSFRELSSLEQQRVLEVLNEARFCDKAPAEVYATLLDEGIYLCSERTMYRILKKNGQICERRRLLRHPAYVAPELMADRPKQLWSWDITKLKTWVKSQYLHLYVILDVFSRYVVGWMVADCESGELAKALIEETCTRQGITPGELTFHADNGSAMVSQPVGFLLASLGVTKSHSRPYVSDDNPFSEAHFKTLKYRPGFPERFASLEHAKPFLRDFFAWYNTEHHHEGLALLTPHDVHHGLVGERLSQRACVLSAAYAAHPERFVHRPPTPAEPPRIVWINPPKATTETEKVRV